MVFIKNLFFFPSFRKNHIVIVFLYVINYFDIKISCGVSKRLPVDMNQCNQQPRNGEPFVSWHTIIFQGCNDMFIVKYLRW